MILLRRLLGIYMDMPVTAYRFTIGRTLKDSLSIFGRNFLPFAGASLLLHLVPLLLPQQDPSQLVAGMSVQWTPYIIQFVASIVISSTTQALVTLGTFANLRGHRATLADMRRGLAFVPLIALGGVVIALPSIASTVVTALAPGNTIVLGVSSIVFGIITLILILRWWVYAPALVFEAIELTGAFSRSYALVRGSLWRIFGLLLLVGLAAGGAVLGTALLAGVPIATIASVEPTSPVGIALFAMTALMAVFSAIMEAVGYYHLRLEKEGALPDEAAQVFD